MMMMMRFHYYDQFLCIKCMYFVGGWIHNFCLTRYRTRRYGKIVCGSIKMEKVDKVWLY